MKSFRPLLDKDPAVQDWAGMGFQSLPSTESRSSWWAWSAARARSVPPVADGRAAHRRQRHLLGETNLAAARQDVGDQVTLGTGTRRRELQIEGEAVFPTLGVLHGDRVSLRERRLDRDSVFPAVVNGGAGRQGASSCDSSRGRTRQQRFAGYGRFAEAHPELVVDTVFTGPKRPADIVNFREMGFAPTVLAGVFGLVALGALANASVVSCGGVGATSHCSRRSASPAGRCR